MKFQDRFGNDLPVMGHPMGAADFSNADFLAKDPESGEVGILFGIDPVEAIELTVVNAFGRTVTQTFQPGPQPYMIKAIKQKTTTVVVNYYI